MRSGLRPLLLGAACLIVLAVALAIGSGLGGSGAARAGEAGEPATG